MSKASTWAERKKETDEIIKARPCFRSESWDITCWDDGLTAVMHVSPLVTRSALLDGAKWILDTFGEAP